MPDSNHQLPPEIPNIPEIPEDAKQYDSFPIPEEPQNSRNSRTTKKKGFKPGRWLLMSWLAIVVSIVGMAFLPSSSDSESYIDYDDSDLPSCITPMPYQVSKPTNNTVMVNFHLKKDDPAIHASLFIDVEITANEEYGDLYNYSHIEMGYGQEEAWSSVIYTSSQLEGVDVEDIEVEVDYDSSYTSDLKDYDYYLEDGEEATYENLMRRYLEHNPEYHPTINILSDGVEQQNGVVQYQMIVNSNDPLYGNAHIIYKNKDEVVYATMVDIDALTNEHTFAYSPPIPLPEYDAVEIQYVLE